LPHAKHFLLVLLLCQACSTRQVIQSIPSQIFHEAAGQRAYVHPVAPPKHELVNYKIIAVQKLENLMLDEIPPHEYELLNRQIVEELSREKLFREVLPITDAAELSNGGADSPVLLFDGFLDNYNAGSRALRLAELGLNHGVVTIRIELKDSNTHELMGSASISVYERGVIRAENSAVHKAAKAAAEFVKKEIALAQKVSS
jgi:hypothetical protein